MKIANKIYCLHLPDRVDRKEHMDGQIKKYDLEVEYVYGIRPKKESNNLSIGGLGCYLGHKKILELAIKDNVDTALIIEDDCEFCNDLEYKIENLFRIVPNDWDVICLGYSWNGELNKNNTHKKINKNILKLYECWCTHAYMLNKESIKLLYNYYNQYVLIPDWYLSNYLCKKNNVYGYFPSLAKQYLSHSDITNSLPTIGYSGWNDTHKAFKYDGE